LSLKDLTGGQDLVVVPAENTTYPDLVNRTQDCELSMVGKPVFHNFLNFSHGAWMRDPMLDGEKKVVEKIWLTNPDDTNVLQVYKNRNELKKNKILRNPYKLSCPYQVG
jgi:hypothetical protein